MKNLLQLFKHIHLTLIWYEDTQIYTSMSVLEMSFMTLGAGAAQKSAASKSGELMILVSGL